MDIDPDVSTAYCTSSKISFAAARFFTGVKKFEHITPALVQLHWLPVPHRVVFRLLLVVFKVINGLYSQLLADLLHHPKSSRSLRLISRDLRMQPKSRTKTCGTRPFAVCAPRIWNSLPLNIRHSSSVSSFQKNLKTFLFKSYSISFTFKSLVFHCSYCLL